MKYISVCFHSRRCVEMKHLLSVVEDKSKIEIALNAVSAKPLESFVIKEDVVRSQSEFAAGLCRRALLRNGYYHRWLKCVAHKIIVDSIDFFFYRK